MKKKYLSLVLFALTVIVIVAVLIVSYRQSRELIESFSNVEESQQTLIKINRLALTSIASTILLVAAFAINFLYQDKIDKLNSKIIEINLSMSWLCEQLTTANAEQQKTEQQLMLANEKLKEANINTQKATTELNHFSYSISHDLRAPLRTISGFCSILMEDFHDNKNESTNKLLATIQSNTKRMEQLISDLLELSRLATQPVNKQHFDMRKLVDLVLENKTNDPVTITVHPMDQSYGDPAMLRQVWENLIGNAIKFSSHKNDPEVEIGFKREGGQDVYWVKDNGAGFNPAYMDKLFKVFSRLHSRKEFEGNGAGLAIAKKIIDAHGGRIWADSTPNEGAVFFFTLPV